MWFDEKQTKCKCAVHICYFFVFSAQQPYWILNLQLSQSEFPLFQDSFWDLGKAHF